MTNIDFSNGFNKANLRSLDIELQKVLTDFGNKYGIKLRLAGGKFSASEFTGKYVATKEGVVDEIKDSNLEYAMRVHGLSKRESAEYKLVEFNSRRPKFPWSVVSKVDGKRYKLTNVTAKVHFA